MFAYLGDARWASIYAVAAGATVAWTSTWWGSGVPWHGGVDPATIPTGAVAGLGLVTWVVLGSWVFLGWRTVMVEAGAVDNRENLATRSATLPPRGLDAGPGHTGTPGHGVPPGNGSPSGNGAMAGNGSPPGNGAMAGNGSPPGSGAMAGNGSAADNGSPPAPVGAENGSVSANGADPANRPMPANESTSPSRGSLSLPK